MNLLLSGATGFLGSHLLKAFINNGYKVTILKRSFSNTWRIEEHLNNVQPVDIDMQPLEKAFEKFGPFDCVVHTAACYGRKGESATKVFESNLAFSLRLLDTATSFNTATFFNTSTILHKYLNYYALSKNQFVDWGFIFGQSKKIRFVNIQLEQVYGPGDDRSKFVTFIIHSCLKNISELKLTPGNQKRDFIYIGDVVSAYQILLKTEVGQVKDFVGYDLGTGSSVNIRNFVKTIQRLIGSSTKLIFGAIPYREHEIMNSKADIGPLRRLGWNPRHSLEKGLLLTIEEEKYNLRDSLSCAT